MTHLLRRLSNPFQNWERHYTASTADLSPQTKDTIFRFQLGSSDFARIDDDTLVVARVVSKKSDATKLLRSCHKCGIVDSDTGHPDTGKIDRTIVKEMPVALSQTTQRELIMLLFFWEEEVVRWRLLDGEAEEIRGSLGEEGVEEGTRRELREALTMIEARKRILPSSRDDSGRIIEPSEGSENLHTLPTYDEARRERYA